MKKEKQIIESLLAGTGLTLNGDKSYDPQIHDERFYNRVLRQRSLGLGESYMEGWWDYEQLDEFFNKLLSSGIDEKVKSSLREMEWSESL